jgi:endonuclease III-like uncharacterized protein
MNAKFQSRESRGISRKNQRRKAFQIYRSKSGKHFRRTETLKEKRPAGDADQHHFVAGDERRKQPANFQNLKNRFENLGKRSRLKKAKLRRDSARRSGESKSESHQRFAAANKAEKHKTLSLKFVEKMPDEEARDFCKTFRGIGPKTVACTLLFACHKEVFPLDTHIFRVLSEWEFCPKKLRTQKRTGFWMNLCRTGKFYSLHVNLIRLGRKICRPQEPLC